MTTNGRSLESECEVFANYLVGCSPQSYVSGKYSEAHRVSTVFSTGSRFDDLLVRAANTHPALTRIADSYARLFAPAALLRKKLVLLLALLETSAPSYHLIDAVGDGGMVTLAARLFLKGMGFGLNVLAGTVLFLPLQMIFASGQRKTG